MRRAKTRTAHSLGLLLLLSGALALGIFLPSIFSALQSRRIDGTEESVDLGPGALSLSSDDMKLAKLSSFHQLMFSHSADTIILDSGRIMDRAAVAALLEDVRSIVAGTELDLGQIGPEDLVSAEPILVVSSAPEMSVDLIWMVFFSRSQAESYQYLEYAVDDATGLILGVSYSNSSIDGLNEVPSQPPATTAMPLIADNLEALYDLNSTDIISQDVSESDSLYMSTFYLSFIHNGARVMDLPVTLRFDGWSINFY